MPGGGNGMVGLNPVKGVDGGELFMRMNGYMEKYVSSGYEELRT